MGECILAVDVEGRVVEEASLRMNWLKMARWRQDVEGIGEEDKEVESQKRVIFDFLVLQIMSLNKIG
jgi:hypothetical protein